ncbi:MAG: hypothetical protein H8E98_00705, partial [Bacteroidetes bacterium]|nr:hypothetical protein [Bacteroidota bacterium]
MNIYHIKVNVQIMRDLGLFTTVANAKISVIVWRLFRSWQQLKTTNMDKSTKEALKGRKKLSPEAMEKRKAVNKKILKFGCFPIVIL